MVNFDQGPGQNIEFYLITSGIDLDPDHGCFTREVYSCLKTIILERAEIHYESPTIREIHNQDTSSFLETYSSINRTIYQFLFGLVEHNNGWTTTTLTDAITNAPLFSKLKPTNGEFSFDFINSRQQGFTLFENQNIGGSDFWVEKKEFYYSSCRPVMSDGVSGDAWLVSDGINPVEIWYKLAFTWVKLQDHILNQNPQGTFFIQDTQPANSANSWWLDPTGIDIRKFSDEIGFWEPTPNNIIVSPNNPGPLTDKDLWVKVDNGQFTLLEFSDIVGDFRNVKFSRFRVQDPTTNSAFVGTTGNNNFQIIGGEDALRGGPVFVIGDIMIRHDEATAIGSLNEVFTDFFTEEPTNDAGITVFFNGIKLKENGWIRSQNDLAVVDVVNGYSTESGDIISARYVF